MQLGGHVADFVQKQRTAFCLYKAAAAAAHGAGKGAFFMAEQLGLQQVFRDGGGVQRNKGLAGAYRVAVQRLGHALFAGAGLAGNQHGYAGLRQAANGTEHILHGRGLAQQGRHGFRAFADGVAAAAFG